MDLQARFKPGLGAPELKHFNMAKPGRIPYWYLHTVLLLPGFFYSLRLITSERMRIKEERRAMRRLG
ncbi:MULTISPECIES: hypothetical protein [unclassified Caballeronia]|uniref:hypothetical protein n=1 Tax=unclassified Caballeronia TaxID=2646786 RepID=UPI002860D3C4|nr:MULTISPECIES: hypothetical protein [unclassified Caballeronia]MDR5813494.1 hypothetical protein [Caballeronia sp. LZ033]MDR5820251.1 hypothetical protein [Caballeronia sp. LZ043]MDR5878068.1 hypothetical protein [Caballeronia sp. LZ032]